VCEAGHRLACVRQERDKWGQHVRVYEAKTDCQACSLAARCLSMPMRKIHATVMAS